MIGGAEVKTSAARYEVSYTIVGDELQAVTAHIFIARDVEVEMADGSMEAHSQEIPVGTLSMGDGRMLMENLPYSNELPLYVADFVGIVNEIVHPALEEKVDPCIL